MATKTVDVLVRDVHAERHKETGGAVLEFEFSQPVEVTGRIFAVALDAKTYARMATMLFGIVAENILAELDNRIIRPAKGSWR